MPRGLKTEENENQLHGTVMFLFTFGGGLRSFGTGGLHEEVEEESDERDDREEGLLLPVGG